MTPRVKAWSVSLCCSLLSASGVHAVTVTVRSAEELRAALNRTRSEDMTVLVEGVIDLAGRGITLPPSEQVVDLIGIPDPHGRQPVIRFGMIWDGDWVNNDRPANGLEFRCRMAFVRGITFKDYEWKGSALAVAVSELFHVEDCTFEDIATREWPPRPGASSPGARDLWYGNVVGAGPGSHLIIRRSAFRRCATVPRGNHCVFGHEQSRSLTILHCTFEAAGETHRSGARTVRAYANTRLVPCTAPATRPAGSEPS